MTPVELRSAARELRASASRLRHEARPGWLEHAMTLERIAREHEEAAG